MTFKVGDWIHHPSYGSGLISAEQASHFTVRFPDAGEKNIVKAFIKEAGTPPFPGFRFPDAKPATKRASGTAKAAGAAKASGTPKAPRPAIAGPALVVKPTRTPAVTIDRYIDRFVAIFPQGFNDPAFDEQERGDITETVKEAQQQLSVAAMDAALAQGHFDTICETARTLASELPLMAKPELVRFLNAVKTPANQESFAVALRDLLHGDESERQRVQSYIGTLEKIGCSVWPVVTYFQFLQTEGATMFFKPVAAQAMAAAVGVSLLYRAEPNWATYARHEEVVSAVEARLADKGMSPRNRLDLQAFMSRSTEAGK